MLFPVFLNGEQTCPHFESVGPIAKAITDADLVILKPLRYTRSMSRGGMKALLDHLCYMWLSHRPDPKMFRKVGLTVCTDGRSGPRPRDEKPCANSLNYWCVKKTFFL